MTTRGQINSNFYQIVDVDSDGNPTDVKPSYVVGMNAPVANVHITGGTNGQFLSTDGSGNLSWATGGGGGNGTPGGSNTQVQFNDAGSFGGNSTFTFNQSTGVVNAPNVTIAGNINMPTSVLADGVMTPVPGNYVAVYDSTGSNGLYVDDTTVSLSHNGNSWTFGANGTLTTTGNIDISTNFYKGDGGYLTNVHASTGNANFANYAGNAFSVSGSNVTGQVNYAAVANSVAVANVSGIGNIATINLNGNGLQTLAGNGSWVTVGTVANANFANFAGNVTVASQPNITSLGSLSNLQFNNTVTPITAATGQMFWDTNEHTVSLGMENGVTQQIGLEGYIYAKADTTITDGQVVMMTGANGNNITIAPANVAAPSFTVQQVLGVATQNIATNGFGYITIYGQVHGLNTNAYNNGDVLWLSTSTPGAMTNVRPVDPNYQIQVATVTKKSAGDGHVQVLVYPFPALTRLSDVETTTPTTGQALVYNGSNVWINGIPNIANIAYSVSGSNVVGAVAYATVANSVAGANVSGTVANANFANYSNVANSANSVAVANVSGIGNIATINLTGSSSNVLYGNGVFASISGGANANYANYAGNVVNASQPNITSLGTLSNLSLSTNSSSVGSTLSITTGGLTHTGVYMPYTWSEGLGAYTGIDMLVTTSNGAVGWPYRARVNSVEVFSVDQNGTTTANSFVGNSFVGNGASLTNVTAQNANAVLSNTSTTTTVYPMFTSSSANGYVSTLKSTGLSANLSNNAITATTFVGNLSGNVPVANVTGIGNIATINLTGSTSNVLYGNGVFAAIAAPGTANFANYAGNVTVAAQGNITSLGTLSSLVVSGTGNVGNLILKTYEETVLASANTSTSISPDFATGTIFRYTANNNFTFNGFTNAVAGSSGTVIITQDGTGSRTLTSTMKFAGNSKTLSTAASSIDIICVFYDGTTYYASLTKGYA